MRQDLNYLTKYRKSYRLEDLIYFISFYAWERLELYSKMSAKVGEEDITNILVSEILTALVEKRVKLPIRLFHSTKEFTNGNDLEIVIPLGDDSNIILPCQAKRLNVENQKNNINAKYSAVHHLVNKGKSNEKEQILCLLEYAKKEGGLPIYLLYNYTENKLEGKVRGLYGCTLVNAYTIYEKKYNDKGKMPPFTFQEIHPPAKPLYSIIELISILNTQFQSQLETFWGSSTHSHIIRPHTNKHLKSQDWWEELCPPFETKRRDTPPLFSQITQNKNINISEEYPFNPKYRIVILKEPIFDRQNNFYS